MSATLEGTTHGVDTDSLWPLPFFPPFSLSLHKKNIHSQHTPSRHAHEQTYTTTIGNKSISKLSLSDNTLVAMMIVGSCVLVLCVQLSANYSPPLLLPTVHGARKTDWPLSAEWTRWNVEWTARHSGKPSSLMLQHQPAWWYTSSS